MKFTTSRLAEAVGLAKLAVDTRANLPVLKCLLLDASDATLTVTGTDLEMEISATVPADITEPGTCAIDAARLSAIVAGSSGDAQIHTTGAQCHIRTAVSRHRLNALEAESFPRMDVPGDGCGRITVPASALAAAIGRVECCAARDDVRYYLNGLYLELEPGMIRLVGSNGHTLALTTVNGDSGDGAISAILPVDAAMAIAKILRDGDASLAIDDTSFRVDSPGARIIAKRIDGKYPDFRRIMQSNLNISFPVDAARLIEVAGRCLITAPRYDGGRIEIGENKLAISTDDAEGQQSNASIEIDYTGPSILAGYNLRYIQQCAKHLECAVAETADTVDSPLVLRSPDSGTIYYIMPMRL